MSRRAPKHACNTPEPCPPRIAKCPDRSPIKIRSRSAHLLMISLVWDGRPPDSHKQTEGLPAPQVQSANVAGLSLSIGQCAQTPVGVGSAIFLGLLIPGACLAHIGVNPAHAQP